MSKKIEFDAAVFEQVLAVRDILALQDDSQIINFVQKIFAVKSDIGEAIKVLHSECEAMPTKKRNVDSRFLQLHDINNTRILKSLVSTYYSAMATDDEEEYPVPLIVINDINEYAGKGMPHENLGLIYLNEAQRDRDLLMLDTYLS